MYIDFLMKNVSIFKQYYFYFRYYMNKYINTIIKSSIFDNIEKDEIANILNNIKISLKKK